MGTAFDERDFGRTCREITRLHFEGLDPKDGVREAIDWSYDRWSMWENSHSYAGAADWLALAESCGEDFERQLVCIAEPVDHMAFDCLRRPQVPYAEAGEPLERDAFLAAVAAEQLSRAEGLVVRALTDGLHWADLEETLAAAVFAHFYDFWHSVIYVVKTRELLTRLGESVERPTLLWLVR